MRKIYKSSALWDHLPTEQELIDNFDPDRDAVVRELPPELIRRYLETLGSSISYNGIDASPLYFTEVYYCPTEFDPICYIDLSEISLKE